MHGAQDLHQCSYCICYPLLWRKHLFEAQRCCSCASHMSTSSCASYMSTRLVEATCLCQINSPLQQQRLQCQIEEQRHYSTLLATMRSTISTCLPCSPPPPTPIFIVLLAQLCQASEYAMPDLLYNKKSGKVMKAQQLESRSVLAAVKRPHLYREAPRLQALEQRYVVAMVQSFLGKDGGG